MAFPKDSFNNFVIKSGAFGFKEDPFTLKSGRQSHFYINWRTALENGQTMNDLKHYIISFTINNGLDPACFYGVPEGATAAGILVQNEWISMSERPETYGYFMGRGKPKEHGDPRNRFFLGEPKGPIVVLEDVTTTGGSLIQGIDNLLAAEYEVIAAIGFTNREVLLPDGKTVDNMLRDRSIPYFSMSKASSLVEKAYTLADPKPNDLVMDAIRQEFKDHSYANLNL